MRMSRESHWYTPSLRPSMDTENRAVVRIFSWYVTWWRETGESRGHHLETIKSTLPQTQVDIPHRNICVCPHNYKTDTHTLGGGC